MWLPWFRFHPSLSPFPVLLSFVLLTHPHFSLFFSWFILPLHTNRVVPDLYVHRTGGCPSRSATRRMFPRKIWRTVLSLRKYQKKSRERSFRCGERRETSPQGDRHLPVYPYSTCSVFEQDFLGCRTEIHWCP